MCCKKAESQRARPFPRRPKAVFRAYRESIELASNATQWPSIAGNMKLRLRIFSEKVAVRFLDLLAFSAPPLGCTIRSGRFPGEPFKNAIELREGLEPYLEGDLADPQI
jgi:hypothetical protein